MNHIILTMAPKSGDADLDNLYAFCRGLMRTWRGAAEITVAVFSQSTGIEIKMTEQGLELGFDVHDIIHTVRQRVKHDTDPDADMIVKWRDEGFYSAEALA